MALEAPTDRLTRFADFYPVYLQLHSHPTNRRLHLLGNTVAVAAVVASMAAWNAWILLAAPILANALHWLGHFRFQRNPPNFRYPVYGAIASWVMFKDALTEKLKWGPSRCKAEAILNRATNFIRSRPRRCLSGAVRSPSPRLSNPYPLLGYWCFTQPFAAAHS